MKALVFGRAVGVWDEMVQAQAFASFDTIIGVGSASADYPGHLDCIVSFHVELIGTWVALRHKRGYPPARRLVTCQRRGLRMYYKDIETVQCEGGSSGLIATFAGLDLYKADHVVLAGVPMDPDKGQYDTKQRWREAIKHRTAWNTNLPKLQGKVKSMSGWTQQLLGAPTPEWLYGETIVAA